MTDPSPARILIVEDDEKLAQLVREFLESNGYDVLLEVRGDRAVGRILGERPDLVLLDLMLPGKDGLTICREIRERYDGVILMLTARGDEVDEVIGLELGADDYVAKPVRPRVLLARIKSLLRRSERSQSSQEEPNEGDKGGDAQRLEVGGLQIDARTRNASLGGRTLQLTTAEFDLLFFLAERAGEVVSREAIYVELRGIEYDGLDRSIDLRVARLRRKLGDDAKQPQLIKSVRGAGYLLADS